MYRYAYRYRRRWSKPQAAAAAGALLGMVALANPGHARASGRGSSGESRAVRTAIAYARHQIGCPYVYGRTGPCSAGFDCSGLVMDAWAAAGVTIPRTSEGQWAGLPHVSHPAPGDLVLAPGSPLDPPPGHVGLYIGHGQVIQAYGAGVPVEVSSLSNFAAGAGGITGYVEVG